MIIKIVLGQTLAIIRIAPNVNWYNSIIKATQSLSVSYNSSSEATYGLRPVFTLKEEVKITGGSGTKDDPYTLGV